MKILVAVDGSPQTQKALDYLVAHRAMFVEGNELTVVHVTTGVPGHVARHLSREVLTDYYDEENAKVLGPVKAFFEKQGITNVRIKGAHGHAAEEILNAATETAAELIVVGTHGHGILGRVLMGSVATKVVSETDISVLLVQ
jgi:nucleotide-binding universal stress UspA family protein